MVNETLVEENREAVITALNEFLQRYPNKTEAAKALGVGRVYVWRMIDGSKPISQSVLEKLGFKVEVTRIKTYSKKETENGN